MHSLLIGCSIISVIITSDNPDLKSYRQMVSVTAMLEMRKTGAERITKGPVQVSLAFFFRRPKSKSKKAFMVVRPDADKLTRACFDSLSNICYWDDSQVTDLYVTKRYGEPERTEIEVREAA